MVLKLEKHTHTTPRVTQRCFEQRFVVMSTLWSLVHMSLGGDSVPLDGDWFNFETLN